MMCWIYLCVHVHLSLWHGMVNNFYVEYISQQFTPSGKCIQVRFMFYNVNNSVFELLITIIYS